MTVWKNRYSLDEQKQKSEGQAEIKIWTEPNGGHPDRDDGGPIGVAGARSRGGVPWSPTSTKTWPFGNKRYTKQKELEYFYFWINL